MNEEVIDNIIKFLETLKQENCNITIVPPHIEEIFGDFENTYGLVVTNIHIEFKGLYKRSNEILANWEKLEK